jgi:hypothetical protein
MTSTGAFFRKWGLALAMLVAIGVFVGIGIYRRSKFRKEHVLIELKAIHTPLGWGYDILSNGRPYIHQNVIPDIKGRHGFQTKEEALAVGQKVYDRLVANQIPEISIEEMRQLNVHLPEDSTDTNQVIKK